MEKEWEKEWGKSGEHYVVLFVSNAEAQSLHISNRVPDSGFLRCI